MVLWLCLRFTELPLQALSQDDRRPTVVVAKQRVVAASDLATEHGVRPGQSSRTASQLLSDLNAHWLDRDPGAESRALEQLLGWAYGFSPTVQRWRDDCLLLEIGGCLTLFGGLDTLLERTLGELSRRGFSAQPGVANTRNAAWVLAHADSRRATNPATPIIERLGPMPLALLEDFGDEVSRLERAGIRDFASLLALPSRSLGRRCSASFRQWLGELTGTRKEVVADYQPPTRFRDALWFGFEVRNRGELLPAMTELLRKLCDFLRHTQLQARVIQWQLLRLQGSAETLDVRSDSAGLDWRAWLTLSNLRLETLEIGRDIEGIALVAETLLPIEQSSRDLFADERYREPRQALLDRLRSRLGLTAIHRIGSRAEHLPEHCVQTGAEISEPGAQLHSAAQRPFWLLPQPQPISERQGQLFWNGPLSLLHGPERIEDGWWQRPISRDYYIAQRECAEPVWIFRDRHTKRWYLHGLFD